MWLMSWGLVCHSFVIVIIIISPLCHVIIPILTPHEPPYKQMLIGMGQVLSWCTSLSPSHHHHPSPLSPLPLLHLPPSSSLI